MIKIPISVDDVQIAKDTIKLFDEQKTHDKFLCENNYLGVLGEMVFKRFLKEQGIVFSSFPFVKKNWDEPDFIIKGKGVDLKTTFDTCLWAQNGKFDEYIFSRINSFEMNELILIGVITGKKIQRMIDEGTANKVTRFANTNPRDDYVFFIKDMKLIEDWLSEVKK